MHGVAATLFTVFAGNLPDRVGCVAFLWPALRARRRYRLKNGPSGNGCMA